MGSLVPIAAEHQPLHVLDALHRPRRRPRSRRRRGRARPRGRAARHHLDQPQPARLAEPRGERGRQRRRRAGDAEPGAAHPAGGRPARR